MLKIENLHKTYKKSIALDGFSCELGRGIYGLLGPNGSGKTTMMRCICGLISYNSGSIECGGDKIGYLPQQFGMMKALTLYEMMEYFATLKRIPKAEQDKEIKSCLELVNLSDKARSRVGSLSGGMVRRSGIAQAILGDPKIILFDEPTAGLDPEERMRFKSLLKKIKDGKTIIISTHIVSDVEAVCGSIIIIDRGKNIFTGSSREMAELARGKAYLIEEGRESSLSGNFYIKDRISRDGKSYLYVLSDSPVHAAARAESGGGIEDGYLCALKNI